MGSSTSQRVLETVWPWKTRAQGQAQPAPKGAPRVRGMFQALVMAGIGFVLYRFVGHRTTAFLVWGFAFVVLASALLVPPVFAAIEGFGRRLGLWLGTGLTYLLLVPFFYLVFVPGRLIQLLLGRDPMKRGFPSPEDSCWVRRDSKPADEHYRRQFS
jgi:hypothetical protein